MNKPVVILNTDKQIKAAILCDRLVWRAIPYSFEAVGMPYAKQYIVAVDEPDVRQALEG